MEKFRWAYVGNGNIAYSTAKSITKGNHIITAVYGRNTNKAKAFADKYNAKVFDSIDDMLACTDIDAVYIATPHTSHVDYAVKAMSAGLPVLCEKPVGVTTADVDKLISASRANNVYFAEAMWTWFSDVALTVKSWIDDGRIGDVQSVHIDYAFPGLMMPKTSRVIMPETAGGALLDIGIYPITYCYNLFGYPDEISCNGEIKGGIDVAEEVVLRYGDMRCVLNMSLKTLKEGCVIKGTEGEIKIPMFHMASRAVLRSNGSRTVYRGKTDYLTEFTAAAREIRDGKMQSDYIPFDATRSCMRIMDECRKQMNLVYPFEKQN